MTERFVTAERFRERAAEVRAEAETFFSPEVRQVLFELAERYDRLANRLDARRNEASKS